MKCTLRGRKINCVMRRFLPSSSVGDRPAPRGCTSTPDECSRWPKMEKSWLFFWYCYNFIYLCVVIINYKVITLW